MDVESGVLLKRGWTEFVVSGDGAELRVRALLAATREGRTPDDLCALFPESEQAVIASLVEELAARRILVPANGAVAESGNGEGPLDVFFWQVAGDDVEPLLERRRVAIVGVNAVSSQIAASLRASGMRNIDVVDFQLLRNQRVYPDGDGAWPPDVAAPVPYEVWSHELDASAYACIVATSDFGPTQELRDWNEFCVEEGRPFLPAVLADGVGFVGPLVVPGETACYECLRARENSNMADPAEQRLVERFATRTQSVAAFHPSMPAVIGHMAALELVKFFTGISVAAAGRILEIDLLEPSLARRKVLKIPRCQVCSALTSRPSSTPYIYEFMHERQ